jgi:predicted deacylase
MVQYSLYQLINRLKMTYTFDEDIVSDLHKDAFGFRPSVCFWDNWKSFNDDEKQVEWDSLLVALENTNAEDSRREKVAIEDFEKLVTMTQHCGAITRDRSLKWIMDGSDCSGDWEYFCYKHGLPYSYFKKIA